MSDEPRVEPLSSFVRRGAVQGRDAELADRIEALESALDSLKASLDAERAAREKAERERDDPTDALKAFQKELEAALRFATTSLELAREKAEGEVEAADAQREAAEAEATHERNCREQVAKTKHVTAEYRDRFKVELDEARRLCGVAEARVKELEAAFPGLIELADQAPNLLGSDLTFIADCRALGGQ